MTQPTNNISTISVFDGMGILEKEVESLVYMLSPAFSRPKLSVLLDQFENGSIKKAGNRVINIYRQPNDYPFMPIAARTTSGSNLLLQATDSLFSAIPVDNMVLAESGCQGKVLDKGEGYILVGFVGNANGNTSFVAADFAVGEQATDAGNIGDLNVRTSKETIFTLPDAIQNIIPTYNQSVNLGFEDFNTRTYLKDSKGGQYYAINKDIQGQQRLLQQYMVRMYNNVPANFSGNQPVAASLINQIVSMGGLQIPLDSRLTEDALKSTIRQYTAQGGFTSNEVVVICGNQYLADFQDAVQPTFLQYVGKNNTIGGQEIKGIDVYNYDYQGLHIKLIPEPILDNKNMFGQGSDGFSRRSRSAIWMNTSPVKVEGLDTTAPFASRYHFGPTADIHRWVINGGFDYNGTPVRNGNNAGKGCQVEYTWDILEQINNPKAGLYHGPSL
jgi:hypothetical protein